MGTENTKVVFVRNIQIDLLETISTTITSFAELESYFTEQVANIEKEIRSNLSEDYTFDVRVEYGYCYECPGRIRLSVNIYRPETLKETERRLKKEETEKRKQDKKIKNGLAKREAQERKTLERLLKKYGTT